MPSQQTQNNPTRYFVFSKETGKILSHYSEDPKCTFEGAIGVLSDNYSVTENTTEIPTDQLDGEGNPVTQTVVTSVTYSLATATIEDYKKAMVTTVPTPQVSEVTLANGLVFDDSEESMAYLQAKCNTSNASEVVYDKYNTSVSMSNSELTAAVSVIATSQMAKDDEYKAKIVEINNASSIDEVKDLAGIYQEKTVKLIVDVDGANFDSTNQVTDESFNQVVMANGGVDLSLISWINAIGVKSINGQTKFVEVVDRNNINTAQIGFSDSFPIINGIVKADGLPAELAMIVYCRNVKNNTAIAM